VATKKCLTKFFFSPLSFLPVFGSGIRDPRSGIRDPGWVKIRIRDKHPGSATLNGKFSNREVGCARNGEVSGSKWESRVFLTYQNYYKSLIPTRSCLWNSKMIQRFDQLFLYLNLLKKSGKRGDLFVPFLNFINKITTTVCLSLYTWAINKNCMEGFLTERWDVRGMVKWVDQRKKGENVEKWGV
jgi:hypothetical protein